MNPGRFIQRARRDTGLGIVDVVPAVAYLPGHVPWSTPCSVSRPDGSDRGFHRVRPPRVHVVYDTETSHDPADRELPFVVGVLADFSGQRREPPATPRDRRFVDIYADNFNEVLRHMRPRVAFEVDNALSTDSSTARIAVDLQFESFDDFLPDRIASRLGPVHELLELRRALDHVRSAPPATQKDALVRAAMAHPEAMKSVRERLTELRYRVAHETTAERVEDDHWTLEAQIAAIDELASHQLDQVMHHPSLQRLEATWRGLKYLLDRTVTSQGLRIRLFDVKKKELWRDLTRAIKVEDSTLFKKVHEEVYAVSGAEPFGMLLGDFEFTLHNPRDSRLLEKIAHVAAAAHAPFLTATSADTFHLESFRQIERPRRPENIFAAPDNAVWSLFRNSEDSRYVALTLPRILLRNRYGDAGVPVDAFRYEEQVTVLEEPAHAGTDPGEGSGRVGGRPASGPDNHLWGNAAWALGAQVSRAFGQYGWCANIWGVESGGLVEGLPVDNVRTRHGIERPQCPVEWPMSGLREAQLADLGFLPILHCKGTPRAAFFSSHTAHKPKVFEGDEATVNARLSSRLPFVFAASRFAHYLKVIVRDNTGRFGSADEVERFLNQWIADYTHDSEDAGVELQAMRPLRQARVGIVETPGVPGEFDARLSLWPGFQLHGLTGSLTVHTRLGSLGLR
jgi:type VI secretion system protein ImpC